MRLRSWLVFFVSIFFSFSHSFGQEPVSGIIHKNSLLFEVGGNGYLYSFNYDRILQQKDRFKTSVRIGWSGYRNSYIINRFITYVPVEFNWMIGKSKNYLELGLGFTPSFGTRAAAVDAGRNQIYRYYYYDFHICPRIGYRLQPDNKRFVLRVGFTPILFSNLFITRYNEYYQYGVLPWAGVSAGWSF